jgi:hypothetical protein
MESNNYADAADEPEFIAANEGLEFDDDESSVGGDGPDLNINNITKAMESMGVKPEDLASAARNMATKVGIRNLALYTGVGLVLASTILPGNKDGN